MQSSITDGGRLIDFEFDILPGLQALSAQILDEETKKNPGGLVAEEAIEAAPPDRSWTAAAILKAEKLIADAGRVVEVETKAYGPAEDVGLLVGVSMP